MKLQQERAEFCRRRVAVKGKPASKPRNYSGASDTLYYVHPTYLSMVGLPNEAEDGRFKSSEEFHRKAGTKANTFKVTGGMWSGLTVTHHLRKAKSQIEQTSIGKSSKHRKLKGKDKEGNQRFSKKPTKVRNSAKAWTIFKNLGINILEATALEDDTSLAALAAEAHSIVDQYIGAGNLELDLKVDRKLYRSIRRRLKRR